MSGISSGVGLISGIDTGSLIAQLLQVDARPRTLVQQRVANLQLTQSAYLDVRSKLDALKSAAVKFRTNKVFDGVGAAVSDTDVLRVTANANAPLGSYSFLVDRLVTTRQLLSKGYADRDSTALGAQTFTFEDVRGRLDRDIDLADLNGGDGITRGKIVVTTASGSTELDLSKIGTVNELLDAFNSDPALGVTASVSGGGVRLESASGEFTVASSLGTPGVAESLGIDGTSSSGVLTGQDVYTLSGVTSLRQLNDGAGVFVGKDVGEGRYDFTITVGGNDVRVNIGSVWELLPDPDTGDDTLEETSGPVSTVQGVLERINTALADAGYSEVTASISNGRIELNDTLTRSLEIKEKNATTTTASDLGLSGTATGTITGGRILAGLNTTLLSNLNGGAGITGKELAITARDGTLIEVDLTGAETTQDVIDLINSGAGNGGKIVASLNKSGNGLAIADTTAGGGNLIVAGESASSLGIETDAGGVAANTVNGSSAQLRYVSLNTRLDEFTGKPVGTGQVRITDGNGVSALIDIGTDTKTVYDLIKEINASANAGGLNIEAALNDNGDGLVIREKGSATDGPNKIKIEDATGAVAQSLGLAGEASGTGDDNAIEASLEVNIEFDAADTLDDVVQKINDAGAPAFATVINDGSQTSPYHISFTARESGRAGRFILDDHGFGLGAQVLEQGEDARVFYGSSDPAKGILLTSDDNTLDSVINGVTIDLLSTSDTNVEVTLSRDTAAIESSVEEFVKAYNAVLDRIDYQSRYDEETETRGPLLGDGTSSLLRSRLASTILSEAEGVSGTFTRLTQVGIEFGEGGRLTFDRERFREAYEEDAASVEQVFTARTQIQKDSKIQVDDGVFVTNRDSDDEFSELGLIFMIEELAKDYTDSIDGVLTQRDSTLSSQIEAQNRRLEDLDEALERKRAKYEAQFLAMERALLQLQGQQNALSQLAG